MLVHFYKFQKKSLIEKISETNLKNNYKIRCLLIKFISTYFDVVWFLVKFVLLEAKVSSEFLGGLFQLMGD